MTDRKLAMAAVALTTVMLVACASGKRPFLIVQMCLANEHEVAALSEDLRAIAKDEGMKFVDGSEDTALSLKRISDRQQSSRVIHMGLERPDGMGLIAGNVGLPTNQIAVGFSEGRVPAEARAFSERVLEVFRRRWQVVVVESGRGASAMASCKSLDVAAN